MHNIYEYIKRPKTVRQEHLDLDDYCIERGGGSTLCKGLLAHLLETTIPDGHMILVCHACNNGKCSNPKHLYWGTPSENRMDRVKYENRTLIEKMEDYYRRKGKLNNESPGGGIGRHAGLRSQSSGASSSLAWGTTIKDNHGKDSESKS